MVRNERNAVESSRGVVLGLFSKLPIGEQLESRIPQMPNKIVINDAGKARRISYIANLKATVGPRFKSCRAHQLPLNA